MVNGRIEQIAVPVELYNNPATAFVASFVGSSNYVRGESGGHRRYKGPCQDASW